MFSPFCEVKQEMLCFFAVLSSGFHSLFDAIKKKHGLLLEQSPRSP